MDPEGRREHHVARTPDDDPEAISGAAEPVIIKAVTAEMPTPWPHGGGRDPGSDAHLLPAPDGRHSAQTVGQFLPSITAWALPPFVAFDASLEFIEQGSLVLDLSAKGEVVWRGVGEAQIKMDLGQDKRVALVNEAVREILERYPPKK